jgi:ubiquinone/menaquinone biosynthesis C-methylase UbiE
MSEADTRRVEAAISLYTKFSLSLYDWWALRFNCSFFWRCPSKNLLNLYNRYVSDNHLDIGVGTGYFMDRCKFPSPNPEITLMDLSSNSFQMAGKRLSRYGPKIYIGNALEEFQVDNQKFDSIGMMNLLHCLPGNMSTKDTVFINAE